MAGPRRRKTIGLRRRVEDEGEEDLDLDDDSLTEGSLATDDEDPAGDSDTSNVDDQSPTAPAVRKTGARATNGHGHGNGNAKVGAASKPQARSGTDKPDKTASLLNGMSNLSVADPPPQPFKELELLGNENDAGSQSPAKSTAPIVVSSSSAVMDQAPDVPPLERRRREHDEYRRRRDEDPSFVPNRGAFFMHDHRHHGPSANGFRPFGRGGRGRGRGGGGIGGPFAPFHHQVHNPADPTTNGPWAHDMHEVVANPVPAPAPTARPPRHAPAHTGRGMVDDGPPNGDGFIPTCPSNPTPINRTLSCEKHIGNAQVRVFIPPLSEPIAFTGIPMKQYTKLPDHRPPLRRDKPVRISLPNFPPRYIFPATDRSFIFIPRAMRPNQQRLRGKPRSGLGSIGGFSRRTSVFGGSYYNGSTYSPSIAVSRRSSIAPDMGRDYLLSPTGSAISRPPMALDAGRPVVRLPPRAEPPSAPFNDSGMHHGEAVPGAGQVTLNPMPQPQMYSLPQKPLMQENKSASIPMHQPRPQKTVSVETIESPTRQQSAQSYQQAFHHQVPVQISNGLAQDAHARQPSYASTGTPLSHIPERAIHAAPFQPNQYPPQGYYPPYQQMMPPHQPGYYYPPPGPYSAAAPAFVPGGQQAQPPGDASQPGGQAAAGANLVAQEVNGMVYYYDAAQLPPVPAYPPYSAPQAFGGAGGVMNMNGMVTPTPDGYYYPQQGNGMVYYPQ